MTGPLRVAVVVTAAVTAGLAGLAGLRPAPAGAQEVRLEAAKKVATAAITRRVLALRQVTTGVKSSLRVSEADRTALLTQLQDQVDGLSSLNARIQGDADEAAVRADAQRIVNDYRVYVLTLPKARGMVVSDIELNAADRLNKVADRLSASIDQASGDQASGKDTAKAKSDLAALRAKVASATGLVSSQPGALLALQPAGYPDNHTTLEQTRVALRAGRTALVEAAGLARAVIADLK